MEMLKGEPQSDDETFGSAYSPVCNMKEGDSPGSIIAGGHHFMDVGSIKSDPDDEMHTGDEDHLNDIKSEDHSSPVTLSAIKNEIKAERWHVSAIKEELQCEVTMDEFEDCIHNHELVNQHEGENRFSAPHSDIDGQGEYITADINRDCEKSSISSRVTVMKSKKVKKTGSASLIPEISKRRYEIAYDRLMKWFDDKKVELNEKSLLAYFVRRSGILKSPASLWSEYSMLKTMINVNLGINIGDYYKLVNFLKKKNVGFVAKKSKVFSRENIIKFMLEAPDEKYLMMKVVMMMGVAGACRREELVNMTVNDIEDRGSVVIVHFPNTKTNIKRSFTIIDSVDDEVHFVDIFRKYVEVRPKESKYNRFFHSYYNGKCTKQVVGINTIGKIPSAIARYLELDNPESYTGHAFRRTSATLLVNTGSDILTLNRHGGWKSTAVAEGYVENCLKTSRVCKQNSVQQQQK